MFRWLRKRDAGDAERLIADGKRAEDAGDLARACELYRQAVTAAPQSVKANLNLGVGLEAAGDPVAAKACYERALLLDPASFAAHYNLGKLLYTQGAYAQAEARLNAALATRPDFADARIVLGYVLQRLGRADEAGRALKVGIEGRPDDLAARAALFHILEGSGDLAGAAETLEGALARRPNWTEALYNYGTTLMDLKRDAEAEAALRRVLALDPRFVLAYRMLASVLHREGRVHELLELCRTGRLNCPDDFDLESFELLALNFTESETPEQLFRRHEAFGARLENAHPPRFRISRASRQDARLRIGYVSGDFNYHPVGLFMLPVLQRHDRAAFAVYAYAASGKSDAMTRRLAQAADVWRDAGTLSDAQLADVIHADGIDILIDLAGHSGASRLGVFAEQPAPVQAAWLGYLNTTGLRRIAYRISDRHCDPVGLTERWHTETLIRLPDSQWCYRPFVKVEHAHTAPVERNGYVTFGSFNQAAKLSRTTRRLWARVLERSPQARLLIVGTARGRAEEALRRDFAALGIATERIEFAPFVPVEDYLRLYDRVDIALDPTPYSGGTTTCDALWMGVPVLTVPGVRPASRSASSVLSTVGLTDWIAVDADDYVRRAVDFAAAPQRLASLRGSLRERMQASALMDEAAFTHDLEDAYREMWRRSGPGQAAQGR